MAVIFLYIMSECSQVATLIFIQTLKWTTYVCNSIRTIGTICDQIHHQFQYLRDSIVKCIKYMFQIAYFTHFSTKEAYNCINFFLRFLSFPTFVHSFIYFSVDIENRKEKFENEKGNEREMYRNEAYGIPYLSDSVTLIHTHAHTLNPILFLLRLWLIIITRVVVVVVVVAFVERTPKESHMLDTQTLNIKILSERLVYIWLMCVRSCARKRQRYIWMMSVREEATPEWDNFSFSLEHWKFGQIPLCKNAFDWLPFFLFVLYFVYLFKSFWI